MSINFEGLVTHTSNKGKFVRLSILDDKVAKKINKILKQKKYTGHRNPIDMGNDTFVVVLSNKTKITSEEGIQHVELLPKIVGWRVKGKLSIKKYKFKSHFASNEGKVIQGVTLNASKIHLGSSTV